MTADFRSTKPDPKNASNVAQRRKVTISLIHEILFRPLDAMGHQGIEGIQERHTWTDIRRSVEEYVIQTHAVQCAHQVTDDHFLCLEHLKASLLSTETPDIHVSIVNPEHPLLSTAWTTHFYHWGVFAGTACIYHSITVFLHGHICDSISFIRLFLASLDFDRSPLC